MDEWRSAMGIFAGISDTDALRSLNTGGDIHLTNFRFGYQASVDVGARDLSLVVSDHADNIMVEVPIRLAVAASELKTVQMSTGIDSDTAWTNDFALITLPSGILIPGDHLLYVKDNASISTSDLYVATLNYMTQSPGGFELFNRP